MIQLAMASDRHLIHQAGVTALSAIRSCSAPIHFNFLTPTRDLEHPSWQTVLESLTAHGAQCSLLPVDFELVNRQLAPHLTPTTYYRLLLTEILPRVTERVIYLDCDILVERDLQQLWTTPLDGMPLAAVSDANFIYWSTLGIDESSGYFNAGVLLIDLAAIRSSGAFTTALEFAMHHPEALTWADQCALNKIFTNRWKKLGREWNYQHGEFLLDVRRFGMRRAKQTAGHSVIHFNNYDRPWLFESAHPMKSAYFSVAHAHPQLAVATPATVGKYWKRVKRFVKWRLVSLPTRRTDWRALSGGGHGQHPAP